MLDYLEQLIIDGTIVAKLETNASGHSLVVFDQKWNVPKQFKSEINEWMAEAKKIVHENQDLNNLKERIAEGTNLTGRPEFERYGSEEFHQLLEKMKRTFVDALKKRISELDCLPVKNNSIVDELKKYVSEILDADVLEESAKDEWRLFLQKYEKYNGVDLKSGLHVLYALEGMIGAKIPHVEQMEWNTFGFKAEDGNVVALALPNKGLKTLPEEIGDLEALEILRLDGNKLKNLPSGLESLQNLKELDLGRNEIHSLPDGIGKLRNLKRIRLFHNMLTSLPESITELTPDLVDLGYNQFDRHPPRIRVWLSSLKERGALYE